MATATSSAPATPLIRAPTIADILRQLDVPAERILARPTPGTATVDDVVAINDRENRLCELVEGVLLEKSMGFKESRLALILRYILESYLEGHDLGMVLGADRMFRLIRISCGFPTFPSFRGINSLVAVILRRKSRRSTPICPSRS